MVDEIIKHHEPPPETYVYVQNERRHHVVHFGVIVATEITPEVKTTYIRADIHEAEISALKAEVERLREALSEITKVKWHDYLKGLDRPTDFAEQQAALFALSDVITQAQEALETRHET